MPLRIDPRVDYVSKRMLGSPEHPTVTIHFLNSMLKLAYPVVAVIILNPLVGKDRSEDKIIVLDILAKDSSGRLFNIEVQTRLPLCFPNRLLYYNCRNYWRQLLEGDEYTKLRPAISISLIDRRMFTLPDTAGRWHHSFRLRCDQDSNLVMTDDFEFHIIELPKFLSESDNIGELPPDQKWLYLFTHAAEMEPEQLSDLLGEEPYREAIGVLEMISKTPEDYQYYEDRLKFLRDQQANLADARQEGREEGREEGRVKGLEEGREEGREVGKLGGKIQLLQELLEEPITPDSELRDLSVDALTSQLAKLNQRLRDRPA
jgi:predicted transposase/invertase (TIGR01784 family)